MTTLRTPWHDVRDHARAIAAQIAPLTTESVALAQSLGRTLATAVHSPINLPIAPTAMMDGYAICGAAPWQIIGTVYAGEVVEKIGDGQALAVNTGAHIPANTRFVIPQEVAVVTNNSVMTTSTFTDGKHVRQVGDEVTEGQLIFTAGTVLTPVHCGLLASLGFDLIGVISQPRVDVLITGNEVITQGQPHAGVIRDSLGIQIPSWITHIGAQVSSVTYCKDDVAQLTDYLSSSTADIIATTGSTSHGSRDYLRDIITSLGGTITIPEFPSKPGHPTFIATLKNTIIIGLPGNPLAALTGFVSALEPIVRELLTQTNSTTETAALDWDNRSGITRILPVRVRNGVAEVSEYIGSAMLRGLTVSTHLAVVPADHIKGEVELLNLPWNR